MVRIAAWAGHGPGGSAVYLMGQASAAGFEHWTCNQVHVNLVNQLVQGLLYVHELSLDAAPCLPSSSVPWRVLWLLASLQYRSQVVFADSLARGLPFVPDKWVLNRSVSDHRIES